MTIIASDFYVTLWKEGDMTDHTWSIREEEKHYMRDEQQRKLPQIQRIRREKHEAYA